MKKVVALLALLMLSIGGAYTPHTGATLTYGFLLAMDTTAVPVDCPGEMADYGACLTMAQRPFAATLEIEGFLSQMPEWVPVGDWEMSAEASVRRGVVMIGSDLYILYVFVFNDGDGSFILVTAEVL